MLVLERVQHRGVDVLLRELPRRGAEVRPRGEKAADQQRNAADPQRALVAAHEGGGALAQAAGGGGAARRRVSVRGARATGRNGCTA